MMVVDGGLGIVSVCAQSTGVTWQREIPLTRKSYDFQGSSLLVIIAGLSLFDRRTSHLRKSECFCLVWLSTRAR